MSLISLPLWSNAVGKGSSLVLDTSPIRMSNTERKLSIAHLAGSFGRELPQDFFNFKVICQNYQLYW